MWPDFCPSLIVDDWNWIGVDIKEYPTLAFLAGNPTLTITAQEFMHEQTQVTCCFRGKYSLNNWVICVLQQHNTWKVWCMVHLMELEDPDTNSLMFGNKCYVVPLTAIIKQSLCWYMWQHGRQILPIYCYCVGVEGGPKTSIVSTGGFLASAVGGLTLISPCRLQTTRLPFLTH